MPSSGWRRVRCGSARRAAYYRFAVPMSVRSCYAASARAARTMMMSAR